MITNYNRKFRLYFSSLSLTFDSKMKILPFTEQTPENGNYWTMNCQVMVFWINKLLIFWWYAVLILLMKSVNQIHSLYFIYYYWWSSFADEILWIEYTVFHSKCAETDHARNLGCNKRKHWITSARLTYGWSQWYSASGHHGWRHCFLKRKKRTKDGFHQS